MTPLSPAVASLSSSLSLLSSSISILDTGVSDFPRLTKVLSTQKHFELLPEHQLREAQQSLVDEIAPAISQLLSTAENYVNQLARKEESLKARSELLKGRLEVSESRRGIGAAAKDRDTGTDGDDTRVQAMDPAKALEAKRLQQKKERLVYAIQRLELESKQKERELRKSMAFVRD